MAAVSCGTVDSAAYSLVGYAAADVSAHRGIDVGIRRMRVLGQERSRCHNLARLAISALRNLLFNPGSLQRRIIQTLNGCDLLAGNP
jgi:hypothetical protein